MIKRLTEKAVRSAGPGKHYDGHGLHLHVRKSGSRQWVQRITVGGRRLDLGLGGWPVVTLAEARIQALEIFGPSGTVETRGRSASRLSRPSRKPPRR